MLEIDKVIVLENKEQYLVLDKTEYENEFYYYIAKLNSTKTDIENNFKIIKVIEKDNNKVIEEVIGEDNLKGILNSFAK